MPELETKIAKYKAKLATASDVDKSQYIQLIRELENRRPQPELKVHTTPEVCESCQ